MLKTDRSKWLQMRRCHRCGATHEARGQRVQSCASCGAHFAPFFFADVTPIKPVLANTYRPLIGFTWWWSDSMLMETQDSKIPRA